MKLVALLGAALIVSGCATSSDRCGARPPVLGVPTPPPAPHEEIVTSPPTEGMSWIGGEWHWDGVRWVWVPGHWLTPPAGTRWIPASYGRDGGGATFQAGSFGCD